MEWKGYTMNRKEYLDAPTIRNGQYDGWLGHLRHREYYRQFVTPAMVARVAAAIGHDVLRASRDGHLNDIPLSKWDNLSVGSSVADAMKAAGDWLSPANKVCVLKEAARQWLESESFQEWPLAYRWQHSDNTSPIMNVARGRTRQEAMENAMATNRGCFGFELFEPAEIQQDVKGE